MPKCQICKKRPATRNYTLTDTKPAAASNRPVSRIHTCPLCHEAVGNCRRPIMHDVLIAALRLLAHETTRPDCKGRPGCPRK